MKKCITFIAAVSSLLLCASCSKSQDGKEAFERIDVDCKALSGSLGSEFAEFASKNTSYIISEFTTESSVTLGGKFSLNDEELQLHVTATEDVYGNVGSISIVPEDEKLDKDLFAYFLNNYESLDLGQWLGAKYNVTAEDGSSTGGVYQTVDETLKLVESSADLDNLLVHAVFGVAPGKAYAVPSIKDGRFCVLIMDNFLRLDYSRLYELIGSDYNTFAADNYIIGSKMSLFGTNYFYCDYALDFAGYAFNCDVNADADAKLITGITLNFASTKTDEQLSMWKAYAAGTEALRLGTFKEAYTSSFGSKGKTFDSPEAVLEYVETKGRPASGFDPDIVVVYGNDKASLTITLKSLSVTMSIK